ncbi:hypothetical protein AVEN_184353-1 [Araneus ventricosus]|uniref:F-box domain-containing protein n=1 Tax=Araneus ventricosus TaxID=182803 RepID=A0A4Y2JK23_ARAVE|nr:hypothetical protein AVEN_17329-1 [Araneus ventricosus]GBM90724.1 hypothetical protein AVEN_184353-1 [Araneus ventricosus]
MSLVCLKWSQGFRSPSVCKKFRFALTNSQLSMRSCPVMKFVLNCSSMFRHVEIEYIECTKKHFIKSWWKHLKLFLHILCSNSQLISVKFQDLSDCIWRIDTPAYDEMCRRITNFLASQHHLKRIEFHSCSFRLHESVHLLRKLTENSNESLSHFILRVFVRSESIYQELDSFLVQSPNTLADLPSLTTLETDYSLIFKLMVLRQSTAIQAVKKYQTRIFQKIILVYYDD